jgi:hypothetical protein
VTEGNDAGGGTQASWPAGGPFYLKSRSWREETLSPPKNLDQHLPHMYSNLHYAFMRSK